VAALPAPHQLSIIHIENPPALWGLVRTLRLWPPIVRRWIDRNRQRRTLLELDDNQLADIGLSRDEALRETSRFGDNPNQEPSYEVDHPRTR
jgi:uncharacterized protein YjiS (DUF1127 family)